MVDVRERLLIKEALESSETLATVLYLIIRQSFGDDAFFWDPTTIFLELKDEFHANPSTEVIDRIAAVQVIVTSDVFFQDPSAFINITNTLADGSPSFSVFNPAEVEEVAWAVTEVAIMRDILPFSLPVKAYVKKMLNIDGYGDDYPEIFDEILGAAPSRQDIIQEAQEMAHDDQRDKIDAFVDDNLNDLIHQINEINSIRQDFWTLMKEDELENVTMV